MLKKQYLILIVFIWMIHSMPSFAQNAPNEPYSRFGLGIVNDEQLSTFLGKGGQGISYNGRNFTLLNPALNVNNQLTVFNVDMDGSSYSLSDMDSTQRNVDFGIKNLALSLPLSKKWIAAVGIKPSYEVNYRTITTGVVENTNEEVTYEYYGNGGNNQIYLINSVRIWRGLSIGANVKYNFGRSEKYEMAFLTFDDTYNLNAIKSEFSNIKGIESQFGIAFKDTINRKINYNVGLTYSPSSKLQATKRTFIESIDDLSNLVRYRNADTVEGSVIVPSRYGVGVSFNRINRWQIGVDFSSQNWSEFRSFGEKDSLSNSYMLRLGGEYIPDYKSVKGPFKGFWSRTSYRLGMFYGTGNVNLMGEQLKEYGLSVGMSFPIRKVIMLQTKEGNVLKQESGTNLAVGVSVGETVSNSDVAINKQFIRFSVGFTLADKWFTKRKIN